MKPAGRFSAPAVALAAVVMGAACTGCGRPARLTLESVPVDSPALAVSVHDLLMEETEHGQQWSFDLLCEQEGGCRGPIRLEVVYRSKGEERKVVVQRELDLPRGGATRVGRSGPVEAVDRVERIRVLPLRRQPAGPTPVPGGPRPTPRS